MFNGHMSHQTGRYNATVHTLQKKTNLHLDKELITTMYFISTGKVIYDRVKNVQCIFHKFMGRVHALHTSDCFTRSRATNVCFLNTNES